MDMAIDTIVIAIGPNDREHVRALAEVGTEIAGPTGATVHLLHVFSEDGFEDLVADDPDLTADSSPDMVASSLRSIRGALDRLDELGIDHDVRGPVSDTPAETVTQSADRLDADMVLIGGGSRSPAGKVLFGDHAQQILLNAPCPVTYVRRDGD